MLNLCQKEVVLHFIAQSYFVHLSDKEEQKEHYSGYEIHEFVNHGKGFLHHSIFYFRLPYFSIILCQLTKVAIPT